MSKDKKPETPNLITGEEEAKLKELIKNLIKKELEEMTGTGAVAGFATKNAFAGGGSHGKKATDATLKQMPGSTVAKEIDEKKDNKKSAPKKKKPDADRDGVPDWADKHPGKDDDDYEKKAKKQRVWKKGVEKLQKDLDALGENEKKLNEVVSRYACLKKNPMRHSYKVSLITQEITKMLREVDFLMTVNERLKNEMNVPTESLWKRTEQRIAEIRSRLKSIGYKLRKIE